MGGFSFAVVSRWARCFLQNEESVDFFECFPVCNLFYCHVFPQGGMGAALLSDPDKIECVSIQFVGFIVPRKIWCLCTITE